MDETELRRNAERHSAAVVAGELDRVVSDLADEALEKVFTLAALLPRMLISADVVRIESNAFCGVADCRYRGRDGDEVTIRSMWVNRDGRALIVDMVPVSRLAAVWMN